jgi:hypothetical protein
MLQVVTWRHRLRYCRQYCVALVMRVHAWLWRCSHRALTRSPSTAQPRKLAGTQDDPTLPTSIKHCLHHRSVLANFVWLLIDRISFTLASVAESAALQAWSAHYVSSLLASRPLLYCFLPSIYCISARAGTTSLRKTQARTARYARIRPLSRLARMANAFLRYNLPCACRTGRLAQITGEPAAIASCRRRGADASTQTLCALHGAPLGPVVGHVCCLVRQVPVHRGANSCICALPALLSCEQRFALCTALRGVAHNIDTIWPSGRQQCTGSDDVSR